MASTNILREGSNKVLVEGVLKENNLEKTTDKKGMTVIRGDVLIQISENEEVTVKFYSAEKTKTGKSNPSYKSLLSALDDYISIAECLKANEPITNASKVQIRNAKLGINDYYNENKKDLSSYIEIRGSFISTAKEEIFEPRAEFELECFVKELKNEIDKKTEEETGRLLIDIIVPVYGGKIMPVTLIAKDDNAEFLSANYEKNKTAFFIGDIINTVTINKVEKGGGFGKKKVETFINTKQELIITGGGVSGDSSQYEDNPDLEDKAFALEDIRKAMAEREMQLEILKSGGKTGNNTKKEIKEAPKEGIF